MNLRKKFSGISSEEQVLKLANDLGYDITSNDLENDDELRDNLLEAVAGGVKGEVTEIDGFNLTQGDGSVIVNYGLQRGETIEGNKRVKNKVK